MQSCALVDIGGIYVQARQKEAFEIGKLTLRSTEKEFVGCVCQLGAIEMGAGVNQEPDDGRVVVDHGVEEGRVAFLVQNMQDGAIPQEEFHCLVAALGAGDVLWG